MTAVNVYEMETRIRDLVMNVLAEPLQKITLQEEILSKYAHSHRRTVRKVHELEYIIQKYQRATLYGEALERKLQNMEEFIAQ